MRRSLVTTVVAFTAAAVGALWASPEEAHAQFTAITRHPLGNQASGFGVAWGDFDGDGDPDLYLSCDGPNLLLRNDGNDDFTDVTMRSAPLDEKYRAFGWEVRSGIDGHDLAAIEEALAWARDVRGKPVCVIFETTKGKGVSFMENNPGFHGAPPSDEQFALAMQELGEAI